MRMERSGQKAKRSAVDLADLGNGTRSTLTDDEPGSFDHESGLGAYWSTPAWSVPVCFCGGMHKPDVVAAFRIRRVSLTSPIIGRSPLGSPSLTGSRWLRGRYLARQNLHLLALRKIL